MTDAEAEEARALAYRVSAARRRAAVARRRVILHGSAAAYAALYRNTRALQAVDAAGVPRQGVERDG